MKLLIQSAFLLLLVASLNACSIADLRTDALVENNVGPSPEEKGRQLLKMAIEKMGYDKLAQSEVYEMTAKFVWSPVWSMMPMNPMPGNKNKNVQFRFATNSFDGHVEYLEGGREGKIYGIQSWEAYQKENAEAPVEKLGSKRYPWALATYHYMTETPMRLLGADIIHYAGSTTFEGQEYDQVFVTWGNGDQKKTYDQWLVYINKTTGFVDLTEVTITDFFLPMPGNMKNATIRFAERVNTDIGAHLPGTVVIQLGRPKEKKEKGVYTFTFKNYKFDSFEKSMLYPIQGLPIYGDSKSIESEK